MNRSGIICLTATLLVLCAPLSSGQVKWAQTGFNFLNVTPDARAAAMGDAVNSISGYAGGLFHNPATIAEMPTLINAAFNNTTWIADIKHLSLGVVVSPFSGEYGVVGVSLQSVDYGDVQGTMVWNNDQGYIDTEIMHPAALAIGIGYAKMISESFGVGAQIRFAYQSLGKSVVEEGGSLVTKQNVANALAYDFGTVFKTGIKSLTFGMSVRNFSKEVKFEQEGFQLPLLFTIGISANLFDFFPVPGPDQKLTIALDSNHPRSHPEQVKMGAEYQFMNIVSLRGGYMSAESEAGATFGAGVSTSGLGITSFDLKVDYSYTPFGVFDNVQRISASFSF